MAALFRIIDPLATKGVKSPFGIHENGTFQFMSLRALMGTLDVLPHNLRTSHKFRYCFVTERKRFLSKKTIESVVVDAFGEDIDFGTVSESLLKIKKRNYNAQFWQDIFEEISLAIYFSDRGESLSAFLHIYRLYEMISVSFPLFYARAEHNYQNALNFMKVFVKQPRDNDLTVMKGFIKVIGKSGDLLRYKVEIDYSSEVDGWSQEYINQLKNFVLKDDLKDCDISEDKRIIKIDFVLFPSFLVSFRNRVFHNALSQGNVNLFRLHGADQACSPIIAPALNWITLVLIVVISQNMAEI